MAFILHNDDLKSLPTMDLAMGALEESSGQMMRRTTERFLQAIRD